jgi:hypothetical protein
LLSQPGAFATISQLQHAQSVTESLHISLDCCGKRQIDRKRGVVMAPPAVAVGHAGGRALLCRGEAFGEQAGKLFAWQEIG